MFRSASEFTRKANSVVSKAMLWLIAVSVVSLALFGQKAPRAAPIPNDPLELVTGPINAVDAPARAAALRLLDRARNSYALRSAGQGYDLKVTFTVNSGGQTEYDGAWEMEDVFDPSQGLRWTAKSSAAYSITRISSNGMFYGEETASHIPLRLQEARAALFDPIPSSKSIEHASIRTSNTVFNDTQLTCVLLSDSAETAGAAPGRRWDETEECIDPQTGLLQTHSQVPGRYYAYEYSNGPQLAGHVLPRKITVTEAGETVTEMSIDSLTEVRSADPSLFVPTQEMKARGRAIAMAGAQKVSRVLGRGTFAPSLEPHVVCVFGVATPSGQLVEAHSLQPSDPNSQLAVDAAKKMSFIRRAPEGLYPEQHFVFVIEKFVSSP